MNEEEKNTEKASRLNEAYRYLFANYNIKSQKQFAEAIRVQRTALSAAFNGNPAYLTKNLFIKICAAFPVFNLDYFLTGRGNLTLAENKIDVTQISNSPGLNIPVAIPSTEIGNANVSVNIYGFSPATQWQTDIAVNCKAADNSVLGSATITNAPFVRNRVSEYSGPLFSDSGSMTLSLNTDWSTSYTGSW